MFWACSLGYFGFLRASEFTVPSLASFSPSYHLGAQDIAVISSLRPRCCHISLTGVRSQAPSFCSRMGSLSRVLCLRTGLGKSWHLRTSQATSPATASASGPPLWQLAMECPITSYKPWAAGQAPPISFILGPRPSH